MTKLNITFLKPGLATTLQDRGRENFQHLGISTGGPLDRQSALLANKLVGNNTNSPVIETTLIGPEIKFDAECVLAITGGNLSPVINGRPCKMYCPVRVNAGEILSFGQAVAGCRSYIAVAGEWLVEKWLGSVSTTIYQPDIFTPDSVIKKNSSITINASKQNINPLNTSVQPKFSSNLKVRILPGPEFDLFTEFSINDFLTKQYELSNDCNRMAYRLKGNIEKFNPSKELISSGIVPGTIQVTNQGQPIILLADAQTTGGYYRIANIIDSDLDILGQLKPGDRISFELCK